MPVGTVEAEIGRREPNRNLDTKPLDLNEDKMQLSRGERTALAQLRSGFRLSTLT